LIQLIVVFVIIALVLWCFVEYRGDK
jgi:hypothetical protein